MKPIMMLAVLMLVGCGGGVWVKDNGTQADFNKDLAECNYDVTKYSGGVGSTYGRDPIADGIEEGMRRNEIRTACMTSKGYHLQRSY